MKTQKKTEDSKKSKVPDDKVEVNEEIISHIDMTPSKCTDIVKTLIDEYAMMGISSKFKPEQMPCFRIKSLVSKFNTNGAERFSNKVVQLAALRKDMGRYIHKDAFYTIVAEFFTAKRLRSLTHKPALDQQPRHWGKSEGWNILQGGEIDPRNDQPVPAGCYMLLNTTEPMPDFDRFRRAGKRTVLASDELKKEYSYRCASCGAEEGKRHHQNQRQIVVLVEGHIENHKTNLQRNLIPQCERCNSKWKDDFIFNINGDPHGIGSTRPYRRSSMAVKIKCVVDEIQKSRDKGEALINGVVSGLNEDGMGKLSAAISKRSGAGKMPESKKSAPKSSSNGEATQLDLVPSA